MQRLIAVALTLLLSHMLWRSRQTRCANRRCVPLGSLIGSVATFGITRESPLGGPRYTANPNTLWISRV